MDDLDIRSLYADGFTVREIAEIDGRHHVTIYRIISDIARPRANPSSTNPFTMRHRARTKMEKHLGYDLPPDKHVHHIDGDPTNNNLSNLEVKTVEDHRLHHWPHKNDQDYIESHRKEYRKEYYANNTEKAKNDVREWRQENREKVRLAANKRYHNTSTRPISICACCGMQYGLNPSSKSKFCSRRCAALNRHRGRNFNGDKT